jgi:hypothetical protein
METYIVPMLLEDVRAIRPVRRNPSQALHGRAIDDPHREGRQPRGGTGITARLEQHAPPP